MARRPTRAQLRRQFEALANEWEPRVRDAFLAAVADIANRAELGRIIEALERGNIQGAIDAVHLDPAAYRALEAALTGAFGAGGAATVAGLPVLRDPTGGNVVLRFDMRAPRVEEWARLYSSTLITRIVDDQREAIRLVIQQGLIDGTNPRTTALNIVGRVSRATNSRVGGIIGLSQPQTEHVMEMRRILADPDAIRSYFIKDRVTGEWKPRFKKTDRRFNGTVLKAIDQGKALPAEMIDRIAGRYGDRLLAYRGEVIAQKETLTALHAAKDEAFRQALDTGAINRQQVTKKWRTAGDEKVRHSHAALDGVSVGFDERFANGLLYPHDPAGAAEEVIGCRCDYDLIVDFLSGIE